MLSDQPRQPNLDDHVAAFRVLVLVLHIDIEIGVLARTTGKKITHLRASTHHRNR